jgi:hypothetical protein
MNKANQTTLFPNNPENGDTSMSKSRSTKVNLLEVAEAEVVGSALEVVRFGSDQTAIIPFTSDSEAIDLHYCQETEISGYVACNGTDCVLCQIGRKPDQRLLLPVYLPTSQSIGILPVSRSLRPFALLPQLSSVLKADKPMVMFVTRGGGKYSVATEELPKDAEGGESVIKQFIENYEAGRYVLSEVYPHIDNEQLRNVEEIGRMMSLKGI